jgi:hypothetical protein
MTISRPRVLARGIAALAFAIAFAAFTAAAPFIGGGTSMVAPAVAAGVAALCLAGLAYAAFTLAGGAPGRARRAYRFAQVGVFAIPVAGLGGGLVAWTASGDVTNFGVSVWATAIAWLALLLPIRGQARDMRSAAQ